MSDTYTIGQRISVRGEDFLVTDIRDGGKGALLLDVVGISPLVRDQAFRFDTAIERSIAPIRPESTHFVADTQSGYRLTKLFIETALRSAVRHSTAITIAHKAAFDRHHYQFVPTVKALRLPRQRMLIADAVGLGKTIEVGIFLAEMIRRGRGRRILVVALKSILKQFQEEIWNRFAIPLVRLDSVGVNRIKTIIPLNKNPFDYYDKTIISVDTLKNSQSFRSYIEHTRWDIIVIDECHIVSNTSSQRGALAQLLADHCDSLILTSATPHNGRRESFAALMRMLEPTSIPLDNKFAAEDIRDYFVRRFKRDLHADPSIAQNFPDRELETAQVPLLREEEEFLLQLHEAFVSYREREGHGAGGELFFSLLLFKSYLSSPAAALESVERRLDKPGSGEERATLLSQRDQLREIKNKHLDSKYRKFCEILKEHGWQGREGDERIVVFTERLETIHYLKESLERDLKISPRPIPSGEGAYPRIAEFRGSMIDTEQNAMIENFGQQDSPIRMLICSDAGAQGVNLHYYCHRMFNYDIPWSLITLQQRNGRIDRYKQPHTPYIHYLVTTSKQEGISADFRILDRLKEKEDEVSRTLGDASEVFKLYSPEKEESAIGQAMMDEVDPKEVDIWELLSAEATATDEVDDALRIDGTKQEVIPTDPEEGLSIYREDMDFYRDLFLQLESDRLIKPDTVSIGGNVIGVTNTEELDRILYDLPGEAKPTRGLRYYLSTSQALVMQSIEQARMVERKTANGVRWAETQPLYDLHPVIRYMLTKLTASIPKDDAPVARLDTLPEGRAYFLIHGQVSNQLGNSVISDFLVCPVREDGSGLLQPIPLEDFIKVYHLREQLYTREVSEGDLTRLKQLLPEALTAAKSELTRLQESELRILKDIVADYRERLRKWSDGESTRLRLIEESELGEGRETPQLRRMKGEMERLKGDRGQFLLDMESLKGEPYLKVVAAFYHFS